ncbi:hypothetical protein FRX31_007868 [Thalictrum thalictroides]|uniref:Uncharacterized protein n=1 Tax=Thalictrum thalictroides TaxID=46969 RepID=A0A7J6WZQ0_THATH|nr:hypothetical protein FRX31_007868 [Thalictrum thalictroides]
MDASQVFEEAEECTSNESGWTMYIASPMHDDDDDGDLSDGEEHDDGEDNEGNDSDDSMLSDASSGPCSHLLEPLGKVDDGTHGIASFNNNKDEYDDRKYYSYNKPNCRQMEKKRGEGRNTKLEKRDQASELVGNSSTSSVLSVSGTNKVRKFSWMGKSN